MHKQDWEQKKHVTKDLSKRDKIISEYCVQLYGNKFDNIDKMVNFLGKKYIFKTGSETSKVPQEINNCSQYKKVVNFLPIKRDSAKAVLKKILASIQEKDHFHFL